VQVVAITLIILWILSLWALLIGRHRPAGLFWLGPFALLSGMLLFFVLSLAGIVFFPLLLPY
jgi:hypothetical protein